MHPSEIKAALLIAGVSQAEIAFRLRRDRSRINAVVNNNSACQRTRLAIAKVLGRDIEEIWPDENFRKDNGRITVPLARAA